MSEPQGRELHPASYLKPCEGTCGRITRPPWMAKHLVPGTVQRVTAKECHTCYRDRQREEGKLPPRKPRGRKPGYGSNKVRGQGGSAEQAHALFLAARNQRLAKQQRKRVA